MTKVQPANFSPELLILLGRARHGGSLTAHTEHPLPKRRWRSGFDCRQFQGRVRLYSFLARPIQSSGRISP